ncbi:copper resistance protein NlpE [Alloalcanivorax sp. C16-2]|uniref:copper resistance protein NlpE n=1 Tax=Alloalcanivorax TaxID=3020832 RepID=UPI001934677D|nr:copper resistance protein NlpE [Alloalcanivorax marinus]MBL7250290.1 copper resistance protein NlpE N-terminal domain-containing protein [Alloalcanivorax marinus]
MKKTLHALGLAATLGLAACQSQPLDPKASSTVYQGVLPCADCAGIKTTLTLYRDQDGEASRFELRQQYLDRGQAGSGQVERGNWVSQRMQLDGQSYPLYVLNPEQPEEQFRFVQNRRNAVEMLNAEGQRIDSDLNYTLMQQ